MPLSLLARAEEIAVHTGVSATTVHRVIAMYNRLGPAAIDQSAKGGRHHEYLTVEQEQAFLQPFFARAQQGEIATAEEIKSTWEAEVKQEVHSSSVYRLLDRHGWRKLVPRPRHRHPPTQRSKPLLKKLSNSGPSGRSHP